MIAEVDPLEGHPPGAGASSTAGSGGSAIAGSVSRISNTRSAAPTASWYALKKEARAPIEAAIVMV